MLTVWNWPPDRIWVMALAMEGFSATQSHLTIAPSGSGGLYDDVRHSLPLQPRREDDRAWPRTRGSALGMAFLHGTSAPD